MKNYPFLENSIHQNEPLLFLSIRTVFEKRVKFHYENVKMISHYIFVIHSNKVPQNKKTSYFDLNFLIKCIFKFIYLISLSALVSILGRGTSLITNRVRRIKRSHYF